MSPSCGHPHARLHSLFTLLRFQRLFKPIVRDEHSVRPGAFSTCSFRSFGETHLPPPTAIFLSPCTSCFPHAFPGSHCTRPPCLCNRCVCITPDAPPPTDHPPLKIDLGTMWLHRWLPRLSSRYLENAGNNRCDCHGRVALLVWLSTRRPREDGLATLLLPILLLRSLLLFFPTKSGQD